MKKQVKILVVNHSPETPPPYGSLLAAKGYHLINAADAAKAQPLAAAENPNLILLPLHPAGGDGLEIVRTLASSGQTRDIPVVIISDKPESPDDLAEGLNLGAADYLIVPFSHEELLARIATQLARAGSNRSHKKHRATSWEPEQFSRAVPKSLSVLRDLFEHSPIGTALTGLDGTLHFNKAFRDMLGYTAAEMRGKTLRDITHPDDLAASFGVIDRIKSSTADQMRLEKRYLRKDGSALWADVLIYQYRDASGNPSPVVTWASDISVRKRMELALRESEEKHRLMLQETSEPIFCLNPDGVFIFVNDAYARLTGKSSEALTGKSVGEIFPPDQAQHRRGILHRVIASGKKEFFSFEYNDPSGEKRYIRSSLEPLYDEKGCVCRIFGIASDVTVENRILEALRNKTALADALIHSSPDGFLIVDAAGRKILQNQRVVDLWKIPRQIADDPDDRVQLAHVKQMAVDPDAFVAKVAYLYDHPLETAHDEVALVDGTVLERYSAPMSGNDGRYYGRIWSFHDITRIRRASDALQANEIKYRSLFDSMNEGCSLHRIVFDERGTPCDYTILDVNPAFEKILGIPRETAVGKRATEVYNIASAPNLEIYARVASSGVPERFEIDFAPMQKSFSITCFSTGEGRFATIFEDCTERKRMVRNLRETSELLSYFIKRSPIYAFIKEVKRGESRVLYASDNYIDMIGIAGAAMTGKTMQELFPPDFAEKITADDGDVVAKGRNLRLEETLNGKRYITYKFPIRQADRTLLAGYSVDISELKNTEEALRESNESLRTIVTSSPLGVIVLDDKGNVKQWNPAAEKIFGWSEREVLGDPLPYIPAERMSEHVAIRNRVLHGEAIEKIEMQRQRKDGTPVDLIISLAPLRDAAGAITGIMSLVMDITDRKRAEAVIQNLQKLESLGALAGGIAHDFNNLLGGIYGYLELSTESPEKPRADKFLSKAMETIERGRDLTRQLITFAKGGTPIREVGRLFPFVKDTARFALSGSSVSCECTVAPDLWPCNFDKNQIGQVVDNIVINAKQAMPSGSVIEISAANVSFVKKAHPILPAGNYVKISIRDHGTGMSKELLPRIFDPFFTTKSTGHGLGLATTFSIVKRHGGTIEVESEPGTGSVFHVILPAASDPVAAPHRKTPVSFEGSGLFLVMDDEEVIREVTRTMLESMGFEVCCTMNGREAIALFKTEMTKGNSIAGAIFDLTVPGAMGGKEAAATLRKLGFDTPLFASSGHADDPIIASPEKFGFTGSICKPFRKSDLTELLRKHLPKK
jgi:PAS domain S-box-containing protein